jgi:hypothetical protein
VASRRSRLHYAADRLWVPTPAPGPRARGRRSPPARAGAAPTGSPRSGRQTCSGPSTSHMAAVDSVRCGVAAPLEATLQNSGVPRASQCFDRGGEGASVNGSLYLLVLKVRRRVRRRSAKNFPIAVDGGGGWFYIPLIDAAADTGCGAGRFPGLPGFVFRGPRPSCSLTSEERKRSVDGGRLARRIERSGDRETNDVTRFETHYRVPGNGRLVCRLCQ